MSKLDPADVAFSQYIRIRDQFCVRCGSPVQFKNGLPVSHDASHFYRRGLEATRFDPDNVDAACRDCHQYWHLNRANYKMFKMHQLGPNRYNALLRKSHQYKKRSRDEALEVARAMLNEIKLQYNDL